MSEREIEEGREKAREGGGVCVREEREKAREGERDRVGGPSGISRDGVIEAGEAAHPAMVRDFLCVCVCVCVCVCKCVCECEPPVLSL